jgi:hypothetical protein
MRRLESMLAKGLWLTRRLWPEVERGYRWVHQAARILKNESERTAIQVRRRLSGLLGAIAVHQPRKGKLAEAIGHFRKVSSSYWRGLFHCYGVAGLPRTNNDLEHLFGSNRYHERRCTGRRNASPAMVLRGPVRLIAATGSRTESLTPRDLAPTDLDAWRRQRAELEQRREARMQRFRFRRNPDAYLKTLEDQLLQPALPP